jgi:DUF971 family protein
MTIQSVFINKKFSSKVQRKLYIRYHSFNQRRILYTPWQKVQMRNTQTIKSGRKEGDISFDWFHDRGIFEFINFIFPLYYHTI